MSAINRRKFLASLGPAAVGLKTGLASQAGALPAPQTSPENEVEKAPDPVFQTKPTIGIQIGAVSFLDEGTRRCSISCRRRAESTRSTSPPSPMETEQPGA